MPKKKTVKMPDGSNGAPQETKFQVINLTGDVLHVPYFKESGKVGNLQVRIKARGGQPPAVIALSQVTPELRQMEQKGFIKLARI